MKKLIATILLYFLVLILIACTDVSKLNLGKDNPSQDLEITQRETEKDIEVKEYTDIKITIEDKIITARLDNSETSKAFLRLLPLKLDMSIWLNREYVGYLDTGLSSHGEEAKDISAGDLTYYTPNGSFVIFYKDVNQSDLIKIGKITSGLSYLKDLGDSFNANIEILN